jgi:mannose-6-phosphate isomerase
MASSDNVLRGGLTNKHIDVYELLKHVKCEPIHPGILKGEELAGELIYKTTAPDFELSSFSVPKGESVSFVSHTAEIMLLVEGEAQIIHKGTKVILKKGSPSAIIFPCDEVRLVATESCWVFKAGVPISRP